mgnify:CR=1 FL=1
MIRTTARIGVGESDPTPAELLALRDRLKALPVHVREELEPLVDDAVESAKFRARAMTLARDALERFRFDLPLMEFDLEATRRERESLRAKLGHCSG